MKALGLVVSDNRFCFMFFPVRGSFFMFEESGSISTNIEFSSGKELFKNYAFVLILCNICYNVCILYILCLLNKIYLNQIKLCGISDNIKQFTHLRSAYGVNSDVIKMAAIALLIRIYMY